MKRKYLSLIISILLLLAFVVGITACSDAFANKNNGVIEQEEPNYDENTLSFIKSDFKFTQEQLTSRIKAEYLRTNKGFRADDQVVLIINLQEESLLALYNSDAHKRYSNIAEYIASEEGKAVSLKIKQEQNAALSYLEQKDFVREMVCSYTAITNGIAIKTEYKNLKEIESYGFVTSAIMSETYNQPVVKSSGSSSLYELMEASATGDTSAIRNLVDIYPTGIFDPSSVKYTGAGTVVAILDNGFDVSHTVFNTKDPEKPTYSMDDIRDIMENPELVATQLTNGLQSYNVYYSEKIPFKYDYADKDYDVNPAYEEHGTHVSGIIGGKDDVISGVAIDTQLVLLKVFPDTGDGGKTEDILMALNDAVVLGVDCINMSLGSACGFTRERDNDEINKIYDAIGEAGISLITAASNDYSSGYGGDQGNTNKVTNPDSGTVGSPSTYDSALSVASISGVMSKYIIANGGQTFFYNESNSISGDQNKFYEELYEQQNLDPNETHTFEYVTVPGVGLRVNFTGLDLTGKIALVKRGDNTFEEKAMLAKSAGAIACIIYNNIEGDILMSMGKTDHVPTISISKSDGELLAKRSTGTMVFNLKQQAGPFMNDFSSWGPTPSLELKPEITGHGGTITSAVHGGGYDELSGTSMACPNVCGLTVLIRQYLKEEYPTYSAKEISNLTNSLLMSTASIVLNERGTAYSPRKQGAGLASLKKTVTTKVYFTVDNEDRPKLQLGDDPTRKGFFAMTFNIVNLSSETLDYEMDLISMTESVSTSDDTFVAEIPYILNNDFALLVNGQATSSKTITIPANGQVKVTINYQLSDDSKAYIDNLFPYGMYVEGFVKAIAKDEDEVSINMPFLAFYGDWTQAPMFDKTYYEVETTAHDNAIDDEDKVKADYYATTPYGSYFYSYIIPLGTYVYDIDTSKYDPIPASEEHIAISNVFGCIDGISNVYAGMLRSARKVSFVIKDKLTGEVVWSQDEYNEQKAHSNGGSAVPYYNELKMKAYQYGLTNNRMYEFEMVAECDYGDGGLSTNVRNMFGFDFQLDDEAPVLKEVKYEKIYDKTLKKDRYYMYLTVYDNHYAMSVTPIIFTEDSYTSLTDHPIPVYSEKNSNTTVKIEITDFLGDIFADDKIPSALAFSLDDYALNTSIYICQLPGTRGDFKFTKSGELDGTDYIILSMYEDELVDLTQYLATSDKTVDSDKSYLKYLDWESSNEKVVKVQDGILLGMNEGRATVTVKERMNLRQAIIIINVKANPNKVQETPELAEAGEALPPLRNEDERKPEHSDINDAALKEVRFSYFDTLFAYSRAAQTSEIGSTGSRIFVSSLSGALSFYPGEKIKLTYVIEPWYVKDKYEFTYESTNPNVVTVDQDGTVTGLKEGSATITLRTPSSTIMARIRISIKNPFVIENRSLVAYKGLGGKVVIPDDEGILYIGSFAFCLYDTDYQVEVTEDDWDANKIPSANTTITEIVIPDGVERIEQYAFYNCTGLRKVTLGKELKHIYKYAFYGNEKLNEINFENVEYAGDYAFAGCKALNNINTPKLYAVGSHAFYDCSSLESIDLTKLRNTGDTAFGNCTSLSDVRLSKDTKLAAAMFVNTALVDVTLKNDNVIIPAFLLAQCENLKTVVIEGNIYEVQEGAFTQCPNLESVVFKGRVDSMGMQVFYSDSALTSITLPNCQTTLGEFAFYECENLAEIVFGANTELLEVNASALQGTKVVKFIVDENNENYKASDDGRLVLSKDGKKIVLSAGGYEFGDYTIDNSIEVIGESSFSGAKITKLTITNPKTIIEFAAFANCNDLVTVVLPNNSSELTLSENAFYGAEALVSVENLDTVSKIGAYAFARSNIRSASIADNATVEEGAFLRSNIEELTIGANARFELGAFQNCSYLKTVNMPENGGVHFGSSCFANCKSLDKIDLSKHDPALESEVFFGCTSLVTAKLTNIVKIGAYAFADCGNLRYIEMPIVTEIGEGAFSAYEGTAPSFMSITLPNTLKTLGDGAFMGANGIEEIEIPRSVLNFGDYLFALCENLKKVTLPSNLTKIGNYWFTRCVRLEEINTENIQYFGEYTFMGVATKLERYIVLDLTSAKTVGEAAFAESAISGDYVCNNLTVIGDYAFKDLAITSFIAPNLAEIGVSAFEDCSKLKTFAFSEKLAYVGSYAFVGATSLQTFKVGEATTGEINDNFFLDVGVLYRVIDENKYELVSIPSALNVQLYEVVEGTVRIDTYAGNENKKIRELVLPNSLRVIGNYAFYGYTSLKNVEFKSFTAPVLESFYQEVELSESDPGYDVLHNQFNATGYELCYFNFIDMAGKKKPINMTLPANKGIKGYDSIVFEAIFGKVENATRSTYVAMEQSMVDFIDYAKKILEIEVITIGHETLVNNAITALNTITQNPETYGIDVEAWDNYVSKVREAKKIVQRAKLKTATNYIKGLQTQIDAFESFDVSDLPALIELATKIRALKGDDRSLLILDNYNKILEEYDAYRQELDAELSPLKDLNNNIATALASVATLTTLAGVGLLTSKRELL